AAGAVGRLQHCWDKAGLTVGSRLLISGDASDRDGRAEMGRLGQTEIILAVGKLGEHFARDGEAVEKPAVPCARPDVVELVRAALLASIACILPPGEPEQEKAV